jgi:hypothetical protein
VIVCDITRAATFEKIPKWIAEFGNNTEVADPTVMVLVNKRDIT